MWRSLWRESGSVNSGYCWASSAQSVSGLSPAELMAIFYYHNSETPPTRRGRSCIYLHQEQGAAWHLFLFHSHGTGRISNASNIIPCSLVVGWTKSRWSCLFAVRLPLQTEILERFKSKVSCMNVEALWYVPNAFNRRDLRIRTVKEEISHYSSQYSACLSVHPNDLAVNLMALPHNIRLLRRHLQNELPTRFSFCFICTYSL
jgi:hypothetical protein